MTSDSKQKPTKISVPAENRAEGDVDRLVYNRFFRNSAGGVLVEVGAARPDYLSISAYFRQINWKVISIEPNPAYQDYYSKAGISVLQYAVDNRDEDDVDFTVVNADLASYRDGNVTFESWSSLSIKEEYGKLKNDLNTSTIKVKVRKLNTILKQHAPEIESIDLICIDIEGWELEALASLNFGKFRPKVLIVENLFQEDKYRLFMRERGYTLWRSVHPNEIYVLKDMLSASEWLYGAIQSSAVTAFWRGRRALGKIIKLKSSR